MNDTSKFDLLPTSVEKLYKRKIIYLGPTGTSGYATAAKGYIYDLIQSNISVQYMPYSTTSNPDVDDNTAFSLFLNKTKTVIINNPTEIIIHSIPSGWDELLLNAKIKYAPTTKIVGRTVWEFDVLPKQWVDSINNSKVTVVSVPTHWNKNTFIKSGVIKPIIVEPHVHVTHPYIKSTFNQLLTKSVYLNDSMEPSTDFTSHYKFYCIAQLIDRKGIDATVTSFCESFTKNDKVLLLLKTFRLNYSSNEQLQTILYLKQLLKKYPDHAPIFYIKDELNYDELKSLHDLGNCYFNLTKTEGFGLGIFDAYKRNKKIIVTGFGGHIEYLGKDYPGLVSYKLHPVNSEIYKGCYLDDQYQWAIADLAHTSKLLKNVIRTQQKIITAPQTIKITESGLSILYIGQYGTCGYAAATKQYIANYIMQNVPVKWEPLYFETSKLDDDNYVNYLAKSAIAKQIKHNTVILHCTPDLWPSYRKKYADKCVGCRVIGYTVWETSRLNPDWVDYINSSVDEVWCPSNYNKDVFTHSGVTIPIKVVPHLFFGSPLPAKLNVTIDGALPDHYTFYNISEFTERKNLKELIECFCQEFTKTDKVQLIIKTHYKGYTADGTNYCKSEIKKITDKYPNHANIVVVYDNLTENQILALHAYGDCYVTLARSEGFGLTVFDAYNYKKQIIATGYSGYLDFLNNNYPGLVNYTLVPVNNGMNGYNNYYTHENQTWAQPDLDDVKNKLRMYYEMYK